MTMTRAQSWFVAALIAVFGGGQSPADDQPSPEALPELLRTFVDELVEITPGRGMFPRTFERSMPGSGESAATRPVTLEHDFAVARYEVPQNLYEAVMGRNPSRWKGARNSAERMTWHEAREFCRRLTVLLREARLIEPSDEIRLPTEIEWEYCCRAGTTTEYSFGDVAQQPGDRGNEARVLDEYAWHTGNAAGNDPPVGALKPNPWGLYDVHGYLWEFCSDAWEEYAAETDSRTADRDHAPVKVVLRGGSWKDRFDQLTSSSRREFGANQRDDAVGFRCVRARAQ